MEQIEAQVDKELEETLQRVAREKKRSQKKERARDAKNDMRTKMSVIAATSINADEDLTLDRRTWEKIRSMEPEDIEQHLPKRGEGSDEEDMNMDPVERKYAFLTDGADQGGAKGGDSDSFSEDEGITRVDRMADEIQGQLNSAKAYKMLKDKKEAKRDRKSKALIDLQRQRKADESEDDKLRNTDVKVGKDSEQESESENDDDLEEERQIKLMAKLKQKGIKIDED